MEKSLTFSAAELVAALVKAGELKAGNYGFIVNHDIDRTLTVIQKRIDSGVEQKTS